MQEKGDEKLDARFFPVCPVCGEALSQNGRTLQCAHRHSFDLAKEGYVNLLAGRSKSGDSIGDSRAMARARHQFLARGYFDALRLAMAQQMQMLTGEDPAVLDICCGEGYYAAGVAAAKPCRLLGFDLSKEMVRLAAKRRVPNALFFVANLSAIPLPDASVDFAMHLFAPFHAEAFSRVLGANGTLISVIPGRDHLFSLKQAIYDTPYRNDEQAPDGGELRLIERTRVKTTVFLQTAEDIRALFSMTPYAYRTSREDLAKLEKLETLETDVDFVLLRYGK